MGPERGEVCALGPGQHAAPSSLQVSSLGLQGTSLSSFLCLLHWFYFPGPRPEAVSLLHAPTPLGCYHPSCGGHSTRPFAISSD